MSEQAITPAEELARPRSRRKLVIVAVALLVLVAGGAFAALQFLGGSEDGDGKVAEPKPVEGAVLDVTTLTSIVSGDASLARVGIAVVTVEGAAEPEVAAKFPLLEDAAVSELARTTAGDLRTADGADALRTRLTKRAKAIYPDGEVLRVLLTELVVQ